MHVLVTGHTGFKGSWLSLLLASLGARVSGIARDPLPGGLFETADISELLAHDLRLDIRDERAVTAAISRIDADVVFHLAAQPLVRESYRAPRETFETNAMGTFNVLEGVAAARSTKAAVIVTTDKVYRNVGQAAGYREPDALGGHDPYSASKAMADLLTQSYTKSFPGPPTAIARAGNVIGGGDVSPDRLLVDLISGFAAGVPVPIRMPEAVRPWQHVLDCLSGYLALGSALLDPAFADSALLDSQASPGAGEWNFGPDAGQVQTVRELADTAASYWGDGATWLDASAADHPHEAARLTLDSTKAQRELGWRNLLPFPASAEWTIEWERAVRAGQHARAVTQHQIDRFIDLGADLPWVARGLL